MSIEKLISMNGVACDCGKTHCFPTRIVTGKGVLAQLPELVREFGGSRVYVLSDRNTMKAAGERVCGLLEACAIPYKSYCFDADPLEPDEWSVGSAVMHYDGSCDLILCVGSGVLNDIAKILSTVSGKPYIIVCTAPSMDGYASASSSMSRDGLKISLPSRSADVIVGDTDILCAAPLVMLRSGLGDMIAKYVSICEWRISHLITGEYYCEQIADLVRTALKRCTDNAQGLMRREEGAVQAVFEGLVISGVAMNYAGISRPASGVEHYISHVLDMRGAALGTPVSPHGIQCAVGTQIAVGLYEKLKAVTPDREKALSYVEAFDYAAWSRELSVLVGKGAQSMIALEKTEQKYSKSLHKERLEAILANWDAVLRIVGEELPTARELEALLDTIGAPKSLADLGVDTCLLPGIFKATKDIRDKYVLSRLLWDLGLIDEFV